MTVVTILDGEWTVDFREVKSKVGTTVTKFKDGSPYNKNNELVSMAYQTSNGKRDMLYFHHEDLPTTIDVGFNHRQLQEILDETNLLVGHNLKADVSWLLECGFTLHEGLQLFDTMVFEYVVARGMKLPLSLAESCIRRRVTNKKDIMHEYLNEGINVDKIPMVELTEYGLGDIDSTVELFNAQKQYLSTYRNREHITPILKAMNDFIYVLVDMERAGAKVDLDVLKDVEKEFHDERNLLEKKIKRLVAQAMGDTEINLDSSEQLSQVVYGLRVIDKKAWADIFNIGNEIRNGVSKKKYAPRMTPKQFSTYVNEGTERIFKTRAEQCPKCEGKGYIRLLKKDGTPRKNMNICPDCNKKGIIYHDLNELAGFGVSPIRASTAIAGGFSAGGDVLDKLLEQPELSNEAKEFLEALSRYSSLTTYLNNFVGGIEKGQQDGFLHIPYKNCQTATGRLSSPFHNLPKGRIFPIKKVFVSRFEGGKIINGDAAALEFRTAGILSKCPEVFAALENNVDIHSHTRDTLTEAGHKWGSSDMKARRDEAKSRTFKPLFAGVSGTKAEKAWFRRFSEWFHGVTSWQEQLGNTALTEKEIYSPSGRVYAFPYTKKFASGRVSNFTQICNYPIQGFGFDIIMTTMIELWRAFKKEGIVHSKIIMNVHDSIVIDAHPDEYEKVISLFEQVVDSIPKILTERYHLKECTIPIPWELQSGPNWMEQTLIENSA